ncbi:MAG TPA: M28 family peptidase [Gemmataceae bacterium]|nr:M28 family peptidase [Gemmataceae bacterium]
MMREWHRRWPLAALTGLLVLWGTRATADNDAIEARMRKDITFLASDQCEGRGPGTKGIDLAAEHIAAAFAKAGLKPGGKEGSYYQPFTVPGGAELKQPNVLRLVGPLGQEIELRHGVDFQVMGFSGSKTVSAPLVFVGYGVNAPRVKYEDFKMLDVAGKVVVLIRRVPRWNSKELPFDKEKKDQHAGLLTKQALAEANKAAAVLLVNDASDLPGGDKLMPFSYIPGSSAIPALHVRRSVIDPILQSSLGMDLRDIERAIDRDLQPRATILAGWTANIQTSVVRKTIAVKNVIGVLEGAGPLAKETVVIGSHYDHLGYGGPGSLNKKPNVKEIHHGADDNASGTTSVIELARRFGAMPNRQGRRLVFMTFSAEEMGLLGSRHYCNKEPIFPLADTVAMVNLDMVGRLRADPKTEKDKLIVEGTGTAKSFNKLIDELNNGTDFQLTKKAGGTGPSDHDSFYRKKVPVFFFFTGMHPDYHRPSDTSDKINVPGMRRVADLAEKVVANLATVKERPEYVEVKGSFTPGPGKIPRIGIIPNYEEDKEGVLVGGVADGGPAAKAGMKAGDVIVEVAGKSVANLNTYMVLMGQQQRGQPLEIGVLRDGKKMTLKVIPQ